MEFGGSEGWALARAEEEEYEGLRQLGPALDCLRASLAVVGRERAAGARVHARLRGVLREVGN